MKLTLPADSAARKLVPLFRGFFRYFPAAIAGAARHSAEGNDQHNLGEEMHHARNKSTDHADCILRHLMDLEDALAFYDRNLLEGEPESQVVDSILKEANAIFWRAGALSQTLHERFAGAPLAPAASFAVPGVESLQCPLTWTSMVGDHYRCVRVVGHSGSCQYDQ